MKRLFFSFLFLITLTACSEDEMIDQTADEKTSIQNVEITDKIFSSEKQNQEINEEELKLSIKTYLDSHTKLDQASYPFQDILDEGEKLTKNQLEQLAEITKLIKQNDENFSSYIAHNTLPEGYREETKRISRYITTYNTFLAELDEVLVELDEDLGNGKFPKVNIQPLIDQSKIVNGREQQKIEDFLNEKNIKTIAFK
ncbi:NDxxF motif lipoprotein [Bacillus xiapuensis]|uniref:NDxxF motif lipoprotein n=1 Tax=Bacillus xiapuensis TaxID=2014075 RepID=UPI000C247DC6|nr:NDxxF motif lipoprotein [Bacillus xiapuensis]